MTVALRGRRAALRVNSTSPPLRQREQICLYDADNGKPTSRKELLLILHPTTTIIFYSRSCQRLNGGIQSQSVSAICNCSNNRDLYSWSNEGQFVFEPVAIVAARTKNCVNHNSCTSTTTTTTKVAITVDPLRSCRRNRQIASLLNPNTSNGSRQLGKNSYNFINSCEVHF